jgi:hypothetical protein
VKDFTTGPDSLVTARKERNLTLPHSKKERMPHAKQQKQKEKDNEKKKKSGL